MTTEDDDDPPVDEVLANALAERLSRSSGRAADVVREHVDAYGEVLPHLLAADIARWYWRVGVHLGTPEAVDADAAVAALTELYVAGDDDMQNVVTTGFLEVLPYPHEEGREIVERLPPPLREELRRMENWRPS